MPFETSTQQLWRRFSKNRIAILSLVIIVLLVLLALFIAFLSHYGIHWPMNPNTTHPQQNLIPPSSQHWIGTNHLGRDIFSLMLQVATISLSVGFTGMVVTLGISLTLSFLSLVRLFSSLL